MHYFKLFVPSLLAALGLPLSVIAALCNGQNQPMVAAAWYEGWAADTITPGSLPYNKLNLITFAFATPSNDAAVIDIDAVSAAALPQIVELAHANGVRVVLSIGGWTGSAYFSTAVSDANRTIFVNAVVALVSQHGVDGVEIDWEYPTLIEGCNVASDTDSANFLTFLQDLRTAIGNTSITISATASDKTWNGPDGVTPLTDVSDYAQVLDYISIMNYDLYGAFSATAGPNSPINDTCAPSVADQHGCAVSGVNNWVSGGFPSTKILMGVPMYGHSFRVLSANALTTSTGQIALYPTADTSDLPLGDGDSPNPEPPVDQCGNPVTPGGVLAFTSMIAQGYLTTNGTPAPGMDFLFDPCSETPYIYDSSTEIMVAYDNAESFEIKGQFITQNKLLGFASWYIGGDSDNILLDAISSGMGIKQCT